MWSRSAEHRTPQVTNDLGTAPSSPTGWSRRIWAVAAVAVVSLTMTACSSSGSASQTSTASTFAGGSPWLGSFVTAALPAPVNALTAVACATATRCWAVGSTVGGSGAPNGAALITTADGGSTWTGQAIPPQVAYLSAISCSDQHRCTAVGQAAQNSNGLAASIATANGGATWTLLPPPAGVLDIATVTCRPDRRCIAIGTTAGGATALVATSPTSGWTVRGALPPGISGATSISCTDDRTCWVTGHTLVDADHVSGALSLTTDGGVTWRAVASPTGLGYLNAVSCLAGSPTGSGALPGRRGSTATPTVPPTSTPSTTAAAGATTTTAPGPATSTTTTVPPPVVGVAGARCTVVGTSATVLNGARTGHGVLLTSDNGGATWTSRAVPATAAALRGLSCTALATCVAVGSTVASAPGGGVIVVTGSTDDPWRRATSVGAPLSLSAVSCVSISSCVTVGEAISEHLSGV